jgi:hypothetical protein
MTMTKQDAIQQFGGDVVYEAESYYETDFGKDFWNDLPDNERRSYLNRAEEKLNLKNYFAKQNAIAAQEISRNNVVELLKNAAQELEKKTGSAFFPNFDFENAPENEIPIYHQVRLACEKIRGNTSGEDGNNVTFKELAALIKYISELLDW